MNFLSVSFFMTTFRDARIPGKLLSIEIGRASSTIGPPQCMYISNSRKKVRLDVDAASAFLGGLRVFAERVQAGRLIDERFFEGECIDFDGDVSLCVDLGIFGGKPTVRLDNEEIEIKGEDLAFLNEACREGLPLARGVRRGTGRGAALAKRYAEQRRMHAIRDQNNPQRSQVDQYGDWIERKCREY